MPGIQRWAGIALAVGAGMLLTSAFLTPPWVFLGLALAGGGALLTRTPLRRMPGLWIGGLFTAWLAWSCFAAWFEGLAGASPLPPGSAFVWLAAPLVGAGFAGHPWRRRVWTILLAVAGLAVLVAGLQYTIGLATTGHVFLKISADGARFAFARGFSEHHLTFGLACALLSVATLLPAGVLCSPAWLNWSSRGVAIIGLTICGSRAAVLGALAGLMMFLAQRGRRWIAIGLALVLGFGAVAALRLYTTDRPRFDRMLRLEDGRWPIWGTAMHLIATRPILGYGGKDGFKAAYPAAFATTYPDKVSEFREGAGHAHNMALALASEYGLPALCLHLAFWIAVLLWLWRRRHESPEGWRLGLGVAAVAFVGGQFEPYPARVMQGAAIHAFLGLAIALALPPTSPQPAIAVKSS